MLVAAASRLLWDSSTLEDRVLCIFALRSRIAHIQQSVLLLYTSTTNITCILSHFSRTRGSASRSAVTLVGFLRQRLPIVITLSADAREPGETVGLAISLDTLKRSKVVHTGRSTRQSRKLYYRES